MKPQVLFELLKETFQEWSEDKAARLAAALSYYTIFSLAPLLIIAIAVAGFFLGRSDVQSQILSEVQTMLGQEGRKFVQGLIQDASRPGASMIATIIGLVTLFVGASGVYGQLQDALNTIWEVEPAPGAGILANLRKRFLSFTMVLGSGFILLVSLVISAGLTAVSNYFSNLLPGTDFLWQVLNQVTSFLVITLLFAMVFKVLPDVEIAWGDVWIGAAVTSLLFTIGKYVIGWYLGTSSPSSTYGGAGSLVALILWIYYSAQILFFGAEFTQVYARRYGSRIRPAEGAVSLAYEPKVREKIPPEVALRMRRKPSEVTTEMTSPQIEQESNRRQSIPVERSPSLAYTLGFGFLLAVVGFIWNRVRGRS